MDMVPLAGVPPQRPNPVIVDFHITVSRGDTGYAASATTVVYEPEGNTTRGNVVDNDPMRFLELLGKKRVIAAVFDPARNPPLNADKDSLFFQALCTLNGDLPDPDDLVTIDMVGQGLYDALPLSVRDLYNQVWGWMADDAKLGTKLLRVRVAFGEKVPELALLPWEFMKVDDQFLCQHPYRSLIREPSKKGPTRKLNLPLNPKMLLWVSTPQGMDELNFAQEVKDIQDAFKQYFGDGVNIELIQPKGQKELFDRIQKDDFDILHYIGHGDSANGKSVLAVEPAEGAALVLVDGGQLQTLLSTNQRVQLVFFNACRTGISAANNVFASLSFNLARYVPVAIAMQYSIADPSALIFAQSFYQEFVKGSGLDASVTAGRRQLMLNQHVETPDWGTPVVCTLSLAI